MLASVHLQRFLENHLCSQYQSEACLSKKQTPRKAASIPRIPEWPGALPSWALDPLPIFSYYKSTSLGRVLKSTSLFLPLNLNWELSPLPNKLPLVFASYCEMNMASIHTVSMLLKGKVFLLFSITTLLSLAVRGQGAARWWTSALLVSYRALCHAL